MGSEKLKAISLEKETPFDIIKCGRGLQKRYQKEDIQMNDVHSLSQGLSHGVFKMNCKYHIVFAPKYRRKVFYAEKRLEIGEIIRKLCEWYGVNIIEAEVCPDHIHMLVEIPPKHAVSSFMGYLKGKSSIMIYNRWGNMKYKYRNRQFWCRGDYEGIGHCVLGYGEKAPAKPRKEHYIYRV